MERRTFLRTSLATGAAPALVPRHAFGGHFQTAPAMPADVAAVRGNGTR